LTIIYDRLEIVVTELSLAQGSLEPAVLDVGRKADGGSISIFCGHCGVTGVPESEIGMECWNCGNKFPVIEMVATSNPGIGPLCETCAKQAKKSRSSTILTPITLKIK